MELCFVRRPRALHDTETPDFVFIYGMLYPWFNTAYPTRTSSNRFSCACSNRALATPPAHVDLRRRARPPATLRAYQAGEFVVGYGTRDVSGEPEAQRAAFFAEAPTALGRKPFFFSAASTRRGVDLLIEAFARHAASRPDYDLVIAGPDRAACALFDQERREPAWPTDSLPGMLSGDAKWRASRAAKFFALPSHQAISASSSPRRWCSGAVADYEHSEHLARGSRRTARDLSSMTMSMASRTDRRGRRR